MLEMIQNILPSKKHDNAVMQAEDVRMTFDEIAAATGTTRKVVTRLFYGALKKIRKNRNMMMLLDEYRNSTTKERHEKEQVICQKKNVSYATNHAGQNTARSAAMRSQCSDHTMDTTDCPRPSTDSLRT